MQKLSFEQASMLLSLNRKTHPAFYKSFDADDATVLANLWVDLFSGEDAEKVISAFRQALKENEFPVTPANVSKILKAQSKSNLPTTDELFDLADKAGKQISMLYHPDIGWMEIGGQEKAHEIYNNLPAILREWKHSETELMRWHNLITDKNESYMRHDFKEIMGDRLNRREVLGIDYNAEFKPTWIGDCMKSLDAQKQIKGGV